MSSLIIHFFFLCLCLSVSLSPSLPLSLSFSLPPLSLLLSPPSNSTFDLDTEKKKRPKLHAKQYIDTVMTNIEKQLQDEATFPTKSGKNSVFH